MADVMPSLKKAGISVRRGAKTAVFDDDGEVFAAISKAEHKKKIARALERAGLRGARGKALLRACYR